MGSELDDQVLNVEHSKLAFEKDVSVYQETSTLVSLQTARTS